MKFQKTLLAASLAVAAVSANAAVVPANPVQVTENLVSDKAIYQNPTTKFEGLVQAPVYGAIATYDQSLGYLNAYANDYLPKVSVIVKDVNNVVGVDLGSQQLGGTTNQGPAIEYDVFKYTNGNTIIYRFQNPTTGAYTGYYTLSNGELTPYTGTVDINTLEKGGKIAGTTGATNLSGFENKVVNGEHVLYGYQGTSQAIAGGVAGTIVAPDGTSTEEYLRGTFPVADVTANDVRYVQTGILANTGNVLTDSTLDASKNIYGVSARDNNKVTMLTGNGIALADLSNKGVLMSDGSIVSQTPINPTASAVQKTRQYNVGGKSVVEVYNDDKDIPSSYFELTGNGNLVTYTGTTPVAGTHIKTGTAQDTSGEFLVSNVHNTVTSEQVRYGEATYKEQQTNIKAGITTAVANTTDVDAVFNAREEIAGTRSEQYAASGVLGKNADQSNKYGFEVVKKDATGTQKTEITANGITTTGVISAADFLVDGKSIVQNIETSVGEATQEVVTKVETQLAANQTFVTETVAAVETKVAAVETGLTAAATDRQVIRSEFAAADTATLASANAYTDTQVVNVNSRVNQLNSRVDDVEKTAYRGVAIALAAQQQIPNIGAGQFAVFGGVGHYEGESAGALGVASVFADGRTSVSAALGFAGGNEVGGRVGVSYVFGGK